jgi:hypothetical protein
MEAGLGLRVMGVLNALGNFSRVEELQYHVDDFERTTSHSATSSFAK